MAQAPATKSDLEGMEARILGSIRDMNTNFNKSQGYQNERMDKEFGEINTKLDALAEDMSKVKLAVVDLLATDKHLHNLVRELKLQGIAIEESRVFSAS